MTFFDKLKCDTTQDGVTLFYYRNLSIFLTI